MGNLPFREPEISAEPIKEPESDKQTSESRLDSFEYIFKTSYHKIFEIKEKDPNYGSNLAIALICSLTSTVIVFGGALFLYYHWRKNSDAQSSDQPNEMVTNF
jgi:hypothetical protein